MLHFELKKLWRRKQFLILTVLVIVTVSALFYRNYWMQDKIVEYQHQTLASHSGSIFALVNEYKDEMFFRSEAGTLDEVFLKRFDQAQLMLENLNSLLAQVENRDWENVPERKLAFLESVQQYIESGGEYEAYTGEELAQKIEYNRILVENSLPYEHDLYSISTTNFMKTVFIHLLSIPGLIVLTLFLGNILVMEKEHQTIRTIVTQPISKSQFIIGKLFGQMGTIVYSILLIALASYFIPLLFGGKKGSFLYPQLILYEEGFTHISLAHYLTLYIVLFLGVSGFAFSINLLFSTLFHDRLTVLFFSYVTLFAGLYVTNQFSALQSKGNPFHFFSINEVIENQQQLGSLLFIAVPYIGAIVLLLLAILFQHYKETTSTGGKELIPFDKGKVSYARSKVSKMFTFEVRKLRREGQVRRLVLLLFMLIAGGYLIISLSTNKLQRNFINRAEGSLAFQENLYESQVEYYEKNQTVLEELRLKGDDLSDYEEELLEKTEGIINGMEGNLNLLKSFVELRKSILQSFQTNDWIVVYDTWIEELTNWWKSDRHVNVYFTEMGKLSDFTFMASIEQYNWMKEHNLTPVLQGRTPPYIWTVYDKFLSPMDQLEWNRETRKFDNTGLFYLYTFFTTPSSLLFLAMILFVLGVGISAEKGIKRTLTFLKTQPITISSVYLSKTWISIIVGLLITLGSWVVMILLGTIFNRFGDLKYPILFYDTPSLVEQEGYSGFVAQEGGFHFITMGKYLLETGGLFLTGVIFLIALSLFISLFVRESMTVFVLTVIISIGGYLVGSMTKLSSVAHFLPFTYLNVGKIANGELAIVLENEGVTLLIGFGTLLVGTTLLILLGWLYSRSRLVKVE